MSTIAENLEAVRARVADACRRSGRQPDEVTLVAVSKTFPLAALEEAAAAGHVVFGENKAQELEEKRNRWAPAGRAVEWHMIGHLQRNKAAIIAQHADVFHALDSVRLARALEKRLSEIDRRLSCLVQVNVSGEPSKFGLEPKDVSRFLDEVAEFEHLRIRGLMTLAAPAEDPEEVRPQFAQLRRLKETAAGGANASLEMLSMGMSGDFEVAIEEGATHVRVGSAIFGSRSYQ